MMNSPTESNIISTPMSGNEWEDEYVSRFDEDAYFDAMRDKEWDDYMRDRERARG